MLDFKSLRFAQAVLTGIELMHMIGKGQFIVESCDGVLFANQFSALAELFRPT
jgi:transposase-like protein